MTRPQPDRTLVAFLVSGMECSLAWHHHALDLLEVKRPTSFLAPIRWLELGKQQIHLIPTDESRHWPRHLAIHVDDVAAARGVMTERGVEIRETVPIPGADRFFIADPDGNNIEMFSTVSVRSPDVAPTVRATAE